MNFDQLLAQTATDSATPLTFPTSWCQGRTAFGGISAAMLLAAAQRKVSHEFRLLSMSTNFIGPLLADTDFHIEIEVLRQGKNSCQILARAIQQSQTCVMAQICFAKHRPSDLSVENNQQCDLRPVDPSFVIPYHSGVSPEFFQHIDLSPQQGAMPFAGADTSHLGGWMKFKIPPTQFSVAHVLALTDAWPPTMLQMFKQAAPASSMSWYIEFLSEPQLERTQWLGFEAITHHSSDGYAIEDAKIWSEAGQLVALSRQTVAIFA